VPSSSDVKSMKWPHGVAAFALRALLKGASWLPSAFIIQSAASPPVVSSLPSEVSSISNSGKSPVVPCSVAERFVTGADQTCEKINLFEIFFGAFLKIRRPRNGVVGRSRPRHPVYATRCRPHFIGLMSDLYRLMPLLAS
jgi:hypothetical protein